MIKKYSLIPLFVLLALAFFLRFFALGSNPVSLTWDEVAWGYNSYALGIDGRDEFGVFLPYAYLESFGDYKPPMYAYLGIIPVKLFGLTEFATRFPSAFFGFLTVVITYFLVKRIFIKSQNAHWYALASTAVLAVSPWHINLSRAAFEANVSTFFIVCGVWLFLTGIQAPLKGSGKWKEWLFVLSAISFVCSLYTFNTARVAVPILVGVLALGFYRNLLERWKVTVIAGVVGLLLVAPIIGFLRSEQAGLRFKEVNIFSDISVTERINQQIENDNNALWSKGLHHRYLTFSVEYLKHYFDHFNPTFLFITGDGNTKFSTQSVGHLYLIEAFFLVLGTLLLVRKKEGSWWIIPLWLLIGIIPAATARETPHALRIESTLPTFQILIGYGLVHACSWIISASRTRTMVKASLAVVGFLYIGSIVMYVHGYYMHYPREYSGEWQYGYKESIQYVMDNKDQYDQVFMTNQSLGRPYIYYLFYTKTDPKHFQATAQIKRDVFGFVTVKGFDKYVFRDNQGQVNTDGKKTLYINIPEDTPENATILKKFNLVDGYHRLNAYEY